METEAQRSARNRAENPARERAYQKKYRASPKGKAKEARYKVRHPGRCTVATRRCKYKKIGLTLEAREALIMRSICEACGVTSPGSKKGWHMDHSPATGKFRGCLCLHCNHAARHGDQSVIDQLRAVIVYLENHQ